VLGNLVNSGTFPIYVLAQYKPRSLLRVANDRFADVFLPGQLDSPDLHRLASNPGDTWQPVTLRQRDGRDRVARAQAVAVADGVLLIFDETAGQGYRGGAALAEGMRRTIEDLRFAEVGPITVSMGVATR